MKQHSTVLMLAARSSIYTLTALMALMAGAEAILFGWALHRGLPAENYSLEAMLEQSWVIVPFYIVLALTTILLCRTGSPTGSRPHYTLARLSVPLWAVYCWQWLYNTLCYLVLYAAQAAVMLGLCVWYTRTAEPTSVTGQTIFLACYRSEILHGFVPLQNTVIWVRNLIVIIGLGAAAAAAPIRRQQGKKETVALGMVCAAMAWQKAELGDFILPTFAILTAVGITLWSCLSAATCTPIGEVDEDA